ncbi:hypothetical protein RCL1_000785 [Eukaryota sp. TZLM3-RCL]
MTTRSRSRDVTVVRSKCPFKTCFDRISTNELSVHFKMSHPKAETLQFEAIGYTKCEVCKLFVSFEDLPLHLSSSHHERSPSQIISPDSCLFSINREANFSLVSSRLKGDLVFQNFIVSLNSCYSLETPIVQDDNKEISSNLFLKEKRKEELIKSSSSKNKMLSQNVKQISGETNNSSLLKSQVFSQSSSQDSVEIVKSSSLKPKISTENLAKNSIETINSSSLNSNILFETLSIDGLCYYCINCKKNFNKSSVLYSTLIRHMNSTKCTISLVKLYHENCEIFAKVFFLY